jgi:NAD dependent epimerase/dehydratase
MDTRKPVLVTGADGFIGSHLVEGLVHLGCHVRALAQYNAMGRFGWLEDLAAEVKNEVEILPADLRDPFAMRQAVKGCSRVFHLGALIAIPYSYIAPAEYVATNISGTLNILQAALEEGVDQVIHTSTSETYGTALYTPIDEKHPLQGQSPYSASKIGADKIAESYHLSFGLPLTTLRPFNTYGPRQSARAVIPTIITQVLAQKEIRLGALTPIRDLTFVRDTVAGFIRAAETPAAIGQLINLGNGKGISVGDLAAKILKLMKCDKPIVTDRQRLRPVKSEVMTLLCDNGKAREILDWQPRVTLEEGLALTIAWLKDHLDEYKPGLYNV